MTLSEQLERSRQLDEQRKRAHLESERKKRCKQEKQRNSCYFSVGRLICKYFPEFEDLNCFDVRTQSVPGLKKLERILRYLSESPQHLQHLLDAADTGITEPQK